MNHKFDRLSILLVFATLVIVAGSALFLSGCTDPLSGEKTPNIAPIVNFTNVPPGVVYDTLSTTPLEVDTVYTRFSRNPFVYWSGTDPDGQIDFYRYKVVTELELAGQSVEDYIVDLLAIGELAQTFDTLRYDTIATTPILEIDSEIDTISVWDKYLYISPLDGVPHTTEVIKLRAFNDDPVNVYLVQHILVQAFDEEGKTSKVAVRSFARNDNPPNTSIRYIDPKEVFINSLAEGIVSGVEIDWTAEDPDYPAGTNAPPFEYEWRLFGPFEDFDGTDSVFAKFSETFILDVYLTDDAKVYRMGDTIISCDTSFGGGGTIVCDTLVVGTDDLSDVRGKQQLLLDIDSLENDEKYNRLVVGSNGWGNDSSVTLFNLYRNFDPPHDSLDNPVDTTVLMNFVFWLNSRDDASVSDPVPAFTSIRVIDPKFERPVIVIDFTHLVKPLHAPLSPTDNRFGPVRNYWKGVIDNWGYANVAGWDNDKFDINLLPHNSGSPDYMIAKASVYESELPVVELLKHKVVIMYNDAIHEANYRKFGPIYRAVEAGVNVWLTMRSPLIGGFKVRDVYDSLVTGMASGGNDYAYYFAASSFSFGGWFAHYTDTLISGRIEAFTYANSLGNWPTIPLDTSLLHAAYKWDDPEFEVYWIPDTAALPEVNWMSWSNIPNRPVGSYEVEPMYLYGSMYGSSHPWGGQLAEFHGSPVAHRLKTNYFKSVHFSFTPLAMQPDSFQVVADTVLNWLYEPELAAPVSKDRYQGNKLLQSYR